MKQFILSIYTKIVCSILVGYHMSNLNVVSDLYVHDCSLCKTRCDGVSKGDYQFKSDAKFSEEYEDMIKQLLIKRTGKVIKKSVQEGYPDLGIYSEDGETLIGLVEVKVQRRTFMAVKRILQWGNL